jgi:Domain of unknown function (DUF5911)
VLDADPSFRPVRRRDGYLALEDMGLIGDGTTSALVGLDGSVPWLCLPRFDSEPLFCGLLDHARGGHFTVAPDEVIEARQRYEPDTAVLVTELQAAPLCVSVFAKGQRFDRAWPLAILPAIRRLLRRRRATGRNCGPRGSTVGPHSRRVG